MDDNTVIDRTIGCDNGRLRLNDVAFRRFNPDAIAIFNFDDARSGKNATAAIGRRPHQTIQILERMKLSLSWKSKDSVSSKCSDWNVADPLDLAQTGPVHRVELVFQICDRTAGRQKEVAIDPGKAAIEVFVADDFLDSINRRGMTLGGKTRKLLAENFFEFVIAII